jgi:serralysin
MRSLRGGRLIEGGAEDDVLRGGRRNDTIRGNEGDDVIIGRGGRDVMFGGEGFDTFAFDDLDAGDVSWGRADAIGDFGLEDLIDLR